MPGYSEDLARRVEALLEPGSPFSRGLGERLAGARAVDAALARVSAAFEDRPGQRALAASMARTLAGGGVLMAEAPTGMGKSLAYLLPSVLLAHEREQRIVIATCSRSLQDQLFERDLPAVLAGLGLEVACVRLKGKQNYLCSRELELEDATAAEERDVLEALRRWEAQDPDGDLDRFPAADPEAFRRLRPRVAADPIACSAATCRRGRECFWIRARRRAAQARILIVNHALLAVSGEVDGLLPDFDALVVDEAHRLEGVLLGQLAKSVCLSRVEELLRLTGPLRRGGRGSKGGLAARLAGFALPLLERVASDGGERWRAELPRLESATEETRRSAEELFLVLAPKGSGHELYGARERYHSSAEILGAHLPLLETVLGQCDRFARTFSRFASDVGSAGAAEPVQALAAELEQVSARWALLARDLQELGDPSARDWVYWRSQSRAGVQLNGAPIAAGAHARRMVFGRSRAIVLTSATLSAGGDVGFLAERLGLGENWGLPYESVLHPSPFPLERQMKTYVYAAGTDESVAVADAVEQLHRATGRNQLVLFTAHERLRRARQRLLERLPHGANLMAQEWDGSASLLSDRFRDARGAILLGVMSLWEGVDFPGGALEILVVAKLPFSVPDEPWVEARAERLKEQGLDPFRHDAVPEAVLRFRQGVGRLIRRSDDRGVLVVCDPRLTTASYRRPFLEALPVAPELFRDAASLAADAARFLGQETTIQEVT